MKYFDLEKKVLPAQLDAGFEMEDYWVWCGSAAKGEDGHYHLFAARWSKQYPFFSGYVLSSEIVHAISNKPQGPYTYVDTVLGDRGELFWDGRMTHNPAIYYHDGLYYLFYIGATFHGKRPVSVKSSEKNKSLLEQIYQSIRIGVATAKSINGPWERKDTPLLDIRIDHWDNTTTTNPSACFMPNGDIYLYYRSTAMQIGVAKGHVRDMQFERIGSTPLFEDHPAWTIEDLFVWHNGENFEMLAKDCNGEITGEKWGGAHLLSQDGIHWEAAPVAKAYSRTVLWDNGRREEFMHFERPSLLFKNKKPIAVFAAIAIKGGASIAGEPKNFDGFLRTKNIALLLADSE